MLRQLQLAPDLAGFVRAAGVTLDQRSLGVVVGALLAAAALLWRLIYGQTSSRDLWRALTESTAAPRRQHL